MDANVGVPIAWVGMLAIPTLVRRARFPLPIRYRGIQGIHRVLLILTLLVERMVRKPMLHLSISWMTLVLVTHTWWIRETVHHQPRGTRMQFHAVPTEDEVKPLFLSDDVDVDDKVLFPPLTPSRWASVHDTLVAIASVVAMGWMTVDATLTRPDWVPAVDPSRWIPVVIGMTLAAWVVLAVATWRDPHRRVLWSSWFLGEYAFVMAGLALASVYPTTGWILVTTGLLGIPLAATWIVPWQWRRAMTAGWNDPHRGYRGHVYVAGSPCAGLTTHTFRTVLATEEGSQAFLQYCEGERNEENVACWMALGDILEVYHLLVDDPPRCRRTRIHHPLHHRLVLLCDWVFQDFVRSGAPSQVNVDSDTRSQIRFAFCAWIMKLQLVGSDAHGLDAALRDIGRTMMDALVEARGCIFQLMHQDIFKRFISSDAYRTLIQFQAARQGGMLYPRIRMRSLRNVAAEHETLDVSVARTSRSLSRAAPKPKRRISAMFHGYVVPPDMDMEMNSDSARIELEDVVGGVLKRIQESRGP